MIVVENICFGCFEVMMDEVCVVVVRVYVLGDIEVFENGFDMVVGECGIILLGG